VGEGAPVRPLEVIRLGRVSYRDGLALQAARIEARRAGRVGDALYLLEHPDVITLGTGSDPAHLVASAEELDALGIEVFETGRGGDVTWHGPGQLVGYPVLDLTPDRKDLHRYLRDLEAVVIRAVAAFGITAGREPGLTGVWTATGKIAAIGVRVSSGWITSHGFALNVDPDLSRFGTIVPCGIADRAVTSMANELGAAPPWDQIERAVVRAFEDEFGARSLD
jgi:lipoyl(octanoyl) transferase